MPYAMRQGRGGGGTWLGRTAHGTTTCARACALWSFGQHDPLLHSHDASSGDGRGGNSLPPHNLPHPQGESRIFRCYTSSFHLGWRGMGTWLPSWRMCPGPRYGQRGWSPLTRRCCGVSPCSRESLMGGRTPLPLNQSSRSSKMSRW